MELLGALTADPFTVGVDITIYDPGLDPDRRGAMLIADVLAGGLLGPTAP